MTGQGGVQISPEQIYDKVVGMEGGLTRVEGLLERHIALQEQHNGSVQTRIDSQDVRITESDGRIAAVDSRVDGLDNRVTIIETDRRHEEKRDTRKATWPQIIGAVAAIIAGISTLAGVLVILGQIANTLGTIAP